MTCPEKTIISAAIKLKGIVVEGYEPRDVILSVPSPGRHNHVLWWAHTHAFDAIYGMTGKDQGFLTSTGRFVDREEAYEIAKAAGQLEGRVKTGNQHDGVLYSEDLW